MNAIRGKMILENTKGISYESRVELLSQFPLFNGLTNNELLDLAVKSEYKKVDRYGFIYHAGEASDCVYFLIKGAVKIGTHSVDGKEIIKSLIHPLAIFGELGVVGQSERQSFAQALKEEVQLLVIKNDVFQRIMNSSFDLTKKVMTLFGSRLANAENKLEAIIFKDARTRIIDFIKDLSTNE